MSQSATNESDEEFHDAVEQMSPVKKPLTDEDVDELVKKQTELNIKDDLKDEETGADGDNETNLGDNELTDEELRELEKDLTAEQLDENKTKADKMKLEANELFKKDNALRAIEIYTEALNICPLSNTKERAVLFGNRAAAKIKIDAEKSATQDCCKSIELWPDYVRVLLRRAKLYEKEDKLEEALKDYKHVNELDPGQLDAREAMIRLPPLITEKNEKLKAEMMSSLKDLGNVLLKPFGLSTNNFQMQQDPNTGSYSINFSQGPKS